MTKRLKKRKKNFTCCWYIFISLTFHFIMWFPFFTIFEFVCKSYFYKVNRDGNARWRHSFACKTQNSLFFSLYSFHSQVSRLTTELVGIICKLCDCFNLKVFNKFLKTYNFNEITCYTRPSNWPLIIYCSWWPLYDIQITFLFFSTSP